VASLIRQESEFQSGGGLSRANAVGLIATIAEDR